MTRRGETTRRRSDQPEVQRITDAPRPRTEDLNQRINRYLISMTIRTVCVVLIFVLHGPGRWAAAVGAIFLPWVAVMFANAADLRGASRVTTAGHPRALGSTDPEGTAEPTVPDAAETVLEGEVLDRPATPDSGPTT